MFLLKVVKLLEDNKIPYALVGGHAVALHGAVRGTMDIDLLTKWTLNNLQKLENVFNKIDLETRLPIQAKDIYQFKDEYIQNRNLIAWNFYNPQKPSEQIDIIITKSLQDISTKKIKIHDVNLNIISKLDLIKMKKESGREQDLLDIEALEKIK